MPRFLNNAVLLLLLAPALANAQQDAQSAAERLVREAFAAEDSMQWGRLVSLIHPRALAAMHQENLRYVTMAEQSRNQPQPRDTTMPECVAEWFERQRAQSEFDSPGFRTVGVNSVAEATRLSPEEFMARWLEAQDARTSVRRVVEPRLANLPDSLPRQASVERAVQAVRVIRTVVGSVIENDSTIAVLFRSGSPDRVLDGVPAITIVRRSPDGWRLSPAYGSQLFTPGYGFGFGFAMEVVNHEAMVEERINRTITWDAGDVPAGRALLAGFGNSRQPQALVVEAGGRRVRIPRSAFDALAELLEIRHYAPRR